MAAGFQVGPPNGENPKRENSKNAGEGPLGSYIPVFPLHSVGDAITVMSRFQGKGCRPHFLVGQC